MTMMTIMMMMMMITLIISTLPESWSDRSHRREVTKWPMEVKKNVSQKENGSYCIHSCSSHWTRQPTNGWDKKISQREICRDFI